MSDAAEVLNAVYESLDGVEGGSAFVDSVFGMRVREVVHCSACGRDSHEAAYTQLFYNVSTTALRFQAMAIETEDEAPASLVRAPFLPLHVLPSQVFWLAWACAAPRSHPISPKLMQVPGLFRQFWLDLSSATSL